MLASPFKDGLIVLVIVLLFFGPRRLPALSRAIGESVKEFKGGITDGSNHEEATPEITATQSGQPAGTGPESTTS